MYEFRFYYVTLAHNAVFAVCRPVSFRLSVMFDG